eukprot:TRINITY_DN4688_c0_g1_i2.p1 TRINITY_DN4688_c0_g1~~TRINITY_DN4688_c0_g1_i2.p1  ORF type:complete len:204 (-),score=40.05 TRINITY_DN4688_c0_g1_i2:255-866(-)
MAEKERLDELYRQGFVHEEEESELASGAQQQGTPSSSPVLGESAPDDEADSESDEERENHEGQTAPAVKFHSALEFLEQVKRNFAQEHGVYEEFLGIMKDFKQQRRALPTICVLLLPFTPLTAWIPLASWRGCGSCFRDTRSFFRASACSCHQDSEMIRRFTALHPRLSHCSSSWLSLLLRFQCRSPRQNQTTCLKLNKHATT